MGLLSVLSVACFVFGSAVIPSEAVPAKQFDFSNRYPIGVQPLIRTNSHRVPSPFGFRKAGARGLISNDVSWLAMLPGHHIGMVHQLAHIRSCEPSPSSQTVLSDTSCRPKR
uniref:Leucine--tRNA ligase n=1 Tax=Lygus hesperus TaxID=30085 RepID=A0A0A9XFJ7_LYGHE